MFFFIDKMIAQNNQKCEKYEIKFCIYELVTNEGAKFMIELKFAYVNIKNENKVNKSFNLENQYN